MAAEQLSDPQTMIRLSTGYLLERALYAVTKLDIADHIKDDRKTARELAKVIEVDPDILHRLMRAVAGMGIFHQDENGAFALTRLGTTLRSDADPSMRSFVLYHHEFVYPSMGEIISSSKSATPGFVKVFGMPFYQFAKENDEAAELFNDFINQNTRFVVPALVSAYDFSDCDRVVDVGGGTGALLSSILAEHETVSGTLFDLPSAIQAAKSGAGGPLPRCELVSGDFFSDKIPHGDTLILKSILHNWKDEKALKILENCRRAVEPDARLLLVERLVGPPNELSDAHYLDLNMMIMNMAQERTEEEYSHLLSSAGFRYSRTFSTESPYHILEYAAQ